jgi:hypothetical protein
MAAKQHAAAKKGASRSGRKGKKAAGGGKKKSPGGRKGKVIRPSLSVDFLDSLFFCLQSVADSLFCFEHLLHFLFAGLNHEEEESVPAGSSAGTDVLLRDAESSVWSVDFLHSGDTE